MSDKVAEALAAADRHQTIRVDGREWSYSSFYKRWEADERNSDPSVRCGECGKPNFTIRYGSYECIARCLACSHEQVVYDG